MSDPDVNTFQRLALLRALGRRIDEWLRYVYDPSTTPLEPDDPPHPRWVALHNDLRALEQRCTDEGWPAALRPRLRALRHHLGGRRQPNPQGLLACRRCGGGMVITELSVVNHKDPDCMLVDVFKGPDTCTTGRRSPSSLASMTGIVVTC